jgi:hypothetical protein
MKISTSLFSLRKINKYNLWVWFLFFSFAYEKPVFIVSSFDRLNPRLFDLVLLLGLTFLFKNRSIYKNPVFKQWITIVMWFTFVVLIGAFAFPLDWKVKMYMFYFLFEYYKGLLAIVVFLSIPQRYYSLEAIVSGLIAGGLFVAIYCLYELKVGVAETIVTDDIVLSKPIETVWGPFVGSYFEIAVFVPLVSSMAFVLLMHGKWLSRKIMSVLTLFISWPVLFTGSRTAIFLFLLTIMIIVIVNLRRSILVFIPLLLFTFSSLILTDTKNLLFDSDHNYTIERMLSLEQDNHHDSILSRLLLFKDFNLDNYDYRDLMPFIGGGFYVAPVSGEARVGYGIHNIYLFPFEQSGIIGVVFFILFIYVSIKILLEGLRTLDKGSLSYWFVVAVYAYFVASLIIGISGHSFWGGFSTGNFNSLRILLLVHASMIVLNSRKNRKDMREKNIISQ